LIRRRQKGKVRRVSDSPAPYHQPHVLVFDSGVGGLSVLREISVLLPRVRLTYAADNAFFPYGTKTESALVARVSSVIHRLVGQVSPDLVVIACNTASTTALDAVRGFLTIPVIGVVPAIKPAAAASRTRVIGLLGTATTVATRYTAALIQEFAAGCDVLTCGATELVEAAERKMQGLPIDDTVVMDVLARLFSQPGGDKLDTIVLGCTHFPLLGPELAASAPHPVAWMDSGAAIARRVATMLKAANAQGDTPFDEGEASAGDHSNRAIFTAKSDALERMRAGLTALGLPEIAFLEPALHPEPDQRQD
jgi:glutamate racemase